MSSSLLTFHILPSESVSQLGQSWRWSCSRPWWPRLDSDQSCTKSSPGCEGIANLGVWYWILLAEQSHDKELEL